MDIVKSFPLLMIQEGISLVNVDGDKGSTTKFGIAQAFHPNIDVSTLTESQAQNIYLNEYWAPAHCNEIKDELKFIHFSCAVNCGVGSAIKILQRASKVSDDGVFGPATLGASNSITIGGYAIEWLAHYKAIVDNDISQSKFLLGWQNRVNQILQWHKQSKL
jgi:lysozyme family protein